MLQQIMPHCIDLCIPIDYSGEGYLVLVAICQKDEKKKQENIIFKYYRLTLRINYVSLWFIDAKQYSCLDCVKKKCVY